MDTELLYAIGEYITTNPRYGQAPVDIDDAVVLNIVGGTDPLMSFGKRQPDLRYPFLQIMVRNKRYEEGIKISNKIVEAMHELPHDKKFPSVLNTRQNGEIITIGRDNKDRYQFYINFTITIGG